MATKKSNGAAGPRRVGLDAQPLSGMKWVPREQLKANGYNPNFVAPPEMRLLEISLLEDGWTQPIVARSDGEIVDGFHRWTLSERPEIAAMTGGLVPVVYFPDDVPLEDQKMSTVRHNRARGAHHISKMAEIVVDLVKAGVPTDEIEQRLQMEFEEVDRLADHAGMVERGADADGFAEAWVPVLPDEEGSTRHE